VTTVLRAFAFGGGVQSTACLVLAAQGRIDFRVFLFANVGADSENPVTLRYVADVARPYAEAHGLTLVELQRTRRNGESETVLGRALSTARSVPIPARMSNGAPGNRTCTVDFKVKVLDKWIKQHGATDETPAVLGLGISLDELHRAHTDRPGEEFKRKTYPLLDQRMTRQDCMNVIRQAGLPIPPKSSCYFCPFHTMGEWQRLKREQPDLFQKSVELEEYMNTKRAALGKDRVWLTRHARPLAEVVGDQGVLEGVFDDNCDSGYCLV
jgi:3'-phosphoadenosine 5'-phosphosulfate sulfotransferase (PAPS reductase)/FAD synthetase